MRPEVRHNVHVRQVLGEGVPIVLIHGVSSSADVWAGVLPALPPDRPIVSYDLRGHGRSPHPPPPWSIDDFVADHLAILDALGIKAADTVGFSLGGLIAQAIAIEHPERVRRLVVAGSIAGRTEEEKERVLARLDRIERLGPYEVAKESVERWFTPEYVAAHPGVHDQVLSRMKELDPVSYAAAYRVLATTDLAAELHRISAPTLAVTGSGDVGSPPHMSERIAATVQQGRSVIIDGAKHSVLQEAPERIAEVIYEHIN
ncbi:alpha/beta fold hydrolase [Sediminivirga luteola]|uniref:3-oxoadipate enol-lactone hydrolase n=1 Tax=Sediminivirga luteola TaxID=1774748 RepID=A0A8J2TVU9_9MICO|nr:alpha/beta fold hydrolase [Sediminivirga luteola]MCI2264315.1 alpha/beta fold hydrolase [Sediminivirga luteola]GGA05275.1 3-oxoadipate enol-lactone hydrolase [Sediminivirga luteola]